MAGDTDEEVSVLVPILQHPQVLDCFLSSLFATLEKKSQIVLIDDGCSAEAKLVLKARAGEAPTLASVEIIENVQPIGAGAALDIALARSRADTIFTLDSDLILEPGWQTGLLRELERRPEAGAVAGTLLYPQTGGINHCGLCFHGDIGRHLLLNGSPQSLPADTFEVQVMANGFTAMRAAAAAAVGQFDPVFYNGYEDLDYLMRMRRAGWRLMVSPHVRAYHWERSNGPHRHTGRKRNVGRFWRLWGAEFRNDLWTFLEPVVSKLLKTGRGANFGVDLCEDRPGAQEIWDLIGADWPISAVANHAHRVDGGAQIWLPVILGADGHLVSERIIFLVDNFVRLQGNAYWLNHRSKIRDDDIVIDLYGNAMLVQALATSAWPGDKIR